MAKAKTRVVIGAFGPSARQIGDAARLITSNPATDLVVKSKPEDGGTVFGDVPYTGRRKKDFERGLSYLHELSERRQLANQVFLGGACDPATRAIATLNEATEFIADGKQRVVLVMDYVEPGTEIAGQALSVKEAMDINIARAELMGWAKSKGVPIHTSIPEAVDHCIEICQAAAEDKLVLAV